MNVDIPSILKSGLLFLREACFKENAFQNNRLGSERVCWSVCYHPPEILTSLYALDLIGDILTDEMRSRVFTLLEPYNDGPLMCPKNLHKVTKYLPDEIDVTALFFCTYLKEGLIQNKQQLRDIAKLIIANVNKDGIMQIYLPPRGEREGRIDATVCCNAMRLLYTLGLGDEAKATEDYIFKILETKEFLKPSLDYHSPDIFLLFLARAINFSPKAKARFLPLLTEAVEERLGSTQFPIDISARILALDALGLLKDAELRQDVEKEKKLLKLQQSEDGAFKEDSLYKKDRKWTFFGGSTVSTIFALAAFNCFSDK